MDNFDMHLLDPIGIAKMRNPDLDIRQPRHFAAILTGQGYGFDALALGRFNGAQDIARIAAGGNTQQHITLPSHRFHIAGEHKLIAKIIGHTGEMAGIRDSDTGITGAIFAITPGQLFSEMHRITMGAAIPTRQHLTLLPERVRDQASSRLDIQQILWFVDEVLQYLGRFIQLTPDQLLIHLFPQSIGNRFLF